LLKLLKIIRKRLEINKIELNKLIKHFEQTKKYNITVIALCGMNKLKGKQMNELGLIAAIVPVPCTLQGAFDNIKEWTADQVEQIIRGAHFVE
jgi:glycerate kinase